MSEEAIAIDAVRSVGGDPDPVATLVRIVCGRAADTPGLLCALLRWDGPGVARDGAEADQVALRRALLPCLADRVRDGMARNLYRTEDVDLMAHALLGILATTIPAWVASGRSDWNALASLVERASVAMLRR